MANKNKRKGSNAEREYAQVFRDLGFSFCKTARQTSRLLDDCGVDLDFLPFNVQIKYGYDNGINETAIIQYVKDKLKENYPLYDTIHKKPIILIHKLSGTSGKKRIPQQELVYMKKDDFYTIGGMPILRKDAKNITKKTKRGWKPETELLEKKFVFFTRDTDENRIVIFTVETLKELITKNKEKWQL